MPRPHTFPYLTAEPQVFQHTVLENDEFVVISSDGLFDILSNEQVVQHVDEYMRKRQELQPENCATFLIRKALVHLSKGNHSEQEILSYLLQVSPETRRMLYDDMTVIVVFLKQFHVPHVAHSRPNLLPNTPNAVWRWLEKRNQLQHLRSGSTLK